MIVHQINVGQGHTTFIEFEDGYRVVIDVDCWEARVDPISYLESIIPADSNGRRRIGLLIVTHPHRDHASGVARLLDVFQVDRVWESGHRMDCDDSWYEDLIEALEDANAEIVTASDAVQLKTDDGGEIRILAPIESITSRNPGDKQDRAEIHARCIVVSLREGDRSILVAGDSRWNEWKERIVDEYRGDGLLEHELLLASHHGSRSFFADSEDDDPYLEGLEAISPEVVLVSVGTNTFDHPHADAIDNYENVTKSILRTDELGTLVCSSDDQGWTIVAYPDEDGAVTDEGADVHPPSGSKGRAAAIILGVAGGAAAATFIRRRKEDPPPRHWSL